MCFLRVFKKFLKVVRVGKKWSEGVKNGVKWGKKLGVESAYIHYLHDRVENIGEKEKMLIPAFSPFLTMFSEGLL